MLYLAQEKSKNLNTINIKLTTLNTFSYMEAL